MYLILANELRFKLALIHVLHFDIANLTSHYQRGTIITIQTARNLVSKEIVLKTTRPGHFLNLYKKVSRYSCINARNSS